MFMLCNFPKSHYPQHVKNKTSYGRYPAFYRISGGDYPGGVGGKTTRHFSTVRSRKNLSVLLETFLPLAMGAQAQRRQEGSRSTQTQILSENQVRPKCKYQT